MPFQHYKDCPQWVPPFKSDVKYLINKDKFPFFEHSDGDFFIAEKDGEIVGRIAAMHNLPYNEYHQSNVLNFALLESIEDQDVFNGLFETIFDWGTKRGLDTVIGPKPFTALEGYGIQVKGFEHHQMMTMMNYNYPYYPVMLENIGFEKEVDFVSCYVRSTDFQMPEKIHRVAERVLEKGKFGIKKFKTKKELKQWGSRIGEAYNKTFVDNWEYYPLSEREIDYVIDAIIITANPKLIKIITYEEEVVGFLFAFPDVSSAIQRCKGNLTPWGIADLLINMKRTNWLSVNGAGVLPQFHGRGGNALLYTELDKTLKEFNFEHFELTQVAETTKQMRKDLITLGGKEYKNHRVYRMKIEQKK
ncbi:MAG: hypothetical protein JEZ03_11610 [Bacteroidales bacterium]|nr:hypothetical protein [Bacteroidales bacterium]